MNRTGVLALLAALALAPTPGQATPRSRDAFEARLAAELREQKPRSGRALGPGQRRPRRGRPRQSRVALREGRGPGAGVLPRQEASRGRGAGARTPPAGDRPGSAGPGPGSVPREHGRPGAHAVARGGQPEADAGRDEGGLPPGPARGRESPRRLLRPGDPGPAGARERRGRDLPESRRSTARDRPRRGGDPPRRVLAGAHRGALGRRRGCARSGPRLGPAGRRLPEDARPPRRRGVRPPGGCFPSWPGQAARGSPSWPCSSPPGRC